MSVLKSLIDTRKLLSDPSRWCQHAIARNEAGEMVPYDYRGAVSWCLFGAIWTCAGDAVNETAETVQQLLPGDSFISRFNDRVTHVEVLALLDAAIAVEQGKQRQRHIDELKRLADAPACERADA